MKQSRSLLLLPLLWGIGLLAGGCLFKQARVPTRDFILTPLPTTEPLPATARPVPVEVGVVKMPSYLLRESLAVRENAGEFKYLDNAHWAERVDRGFQRTLTENLSLLLASGETHPSSADDIGSKLMVSVDVQQFDVDIRGRGTLLARWRVTRPGSDEPAKSGHSQLNQNGPSPQGNPQVVAATLSALIAQFSRDLAQEIGGYPPGRHEQP